MVKPIPNNVKEILNQLSSSQQVILRSYIATLRSEIVSLEEEEKLNNDDPSQQHAHYHGDVKCTADHGHVDTEHNNNNHHNHHEHVHTEHCQHDHHDHKQDHHNNNTTTTKDSHNHHHHDEHGHNNEHGHKDHHGHDHHHHHHDDDNHKHDCEHDHHHGHDHTKEKVHNNNNNDDDDANNIPAWKKLAMDADPTTAPFGGNWQSESNISASNDAAAVVIDDDEIKQSTMEE